MKPYINKTARIIVGIICGVLLVAQVQAFAGQEIGNKQDMHERWEKKISAIHEKLELTEEQKTQLKAHKEEHRAEMKELKVSIKDKKDQMRQELQKTDFDMNKVQQLNEELKFLKNQKADHRLSGIIQVRKILTPEQFSQFMALKEEWKHKKRHHPDKGSKGSMTMQETAEDSPAPATE